MKFLLIFLLLLAIAGGAFYYYYINNPYFQNKPVTRDGKVANMTIQSLAFINNQQIPSKYTCDGENVNPPLTFSEIPYGTKSLVLVMDDPDSPSKDFTHWVMFNISPETTTLGDKFESENVTLGKNDFGKNEYGGPCPQTGIHKYRFRLFALNTILLLQKGSTKAQVLDKIKGFTLGESQLFGTYKRQ